jgi:hypothetical protein
VTTKNVAASVRDRLAQKAKATNRPFQELLQFYAIERFLYRLATSRFQKQFVLKGALMLRVWDAPAARPTRDVDLLGAVDNSLDTIATVVREICSTDVTADGLSFDPNAVTCERIKEDAEYEGVRVRFYGLLGNARVPMQIDIAFGDAVVSTPPLVDYPTLLDLPAPHLRGYPRETVVAEKFEAMVQLSTLNSRMKDFFDLWLLSRHFDFDGVALAKQVLATFEHRGTKLDPKPVALTSEFTDTAQKMWTAYIKKGGFDAVPGQLAEVTDSLQLFLHPVAEACAARSAFARRWTAPGPWAG